MPKLRPLTKGRCEVSVGWFAELPDLCDRFGLCADSGRSDNHNPLKRNLAGRIQLRRQR